MKIRHFAKAQTEYGEMIHAVPVEYRNRKVDIRNKRTLCGQLARFSLEGCSDEIDCQRCLKALNR
jgi:hypothetical protein